MTDHGLPILFAIALWWFSTGAVLMVSRVQRHTLAWMLGGTAATAGFAIGVLAQSAWLVTPAGAYVAFTAAVVLWGCIEFTFLTGLVTGPRTSACPAGAKGWSRFRFATETLLYHELLIAGVALTAVLVTWNAPNQTGTFAFLILLAMRISAKLNIFLGVPNLTDDLMPARLTYLKSYFRKAEGNAFFPVSMIASAAVAALLAWRAIDAATGGGEATGFSLLFGLLVLAIVEHIFMILPLRDGALWRWAMPASTERRR